MEYKILESNGVEIDILDGAALNNLIAGKSGIVPGVLDECVIASPSSNTVVVSTGQLMIQGFRVKLTEPFLASMTSFPQGGATFQIIAKIEVLSDSSVQFSLFCREKATLVQEDILKIGQGQYEMELGSFYLDSQGLRSLKKTAPFVGPQSSKVYLHTISLSTNGPPAKAYLYSYSSSPITMEDWNWTLVNKKLFNRFGHVNSDSYFISFTYVTTETTVSYISLMDGQIIVKEYQITGLLDSVTEAFLS